MHKQFRINAVCFSSFCEDFAKVFGPNAGVIALPIASVFVSCLLYLFFAFLPWCSCRLTA